jgi:hypothetical protein
MRLGAIALAIAFASAPVVLDACTISCGSQRAEDGPSHAACHHGAADAVSSMRSDRSCSHDHSETASSADDHVKTPPVLRLVRTVLTVAAAAHLLERAAAFRSPAASASPPRASTAPAPIPLRI